VNPDSLFCSEFGLAFKLCGGREPESKNISEHSCAKAQNNHQHNRKTTIHAFPLPLGVPTCYFGCKLHRARLRGIYVLAAYPTSLFRLNAIQILFRSRLLRPKPHPPFSALRQESLPGE
jgi:hypothetical protein